MRSALLSCSMERGSQYNPIPFNKTVRELMSDLKSLRNNKVASLSRAFNDHLNCDVVLALCCTTLFIECLNVSAFAAQRKDSVSLVIPKTKGYTTAPSSWQGLAKRSDFCNLR